MLFTCELCSGVCCLTPPQLDGEDEIKKAINYNVRIVAFKKDKDLYATAISKKDGRCPFLINGKCSIYGNNFKICKEFECKSLDMDITDVKDNAILGWKFLNGLIENKHQPNGLEYVSKEVIQKYDIPVLDFNSILDEVYLTDMSIFNSLISKIMDNIEK